MVNFSAPPKVEETEIIKKNIEISEVMPIENNEEEIAENTLFDDGFER